MSLFDTVLEALKALHERKSKDYGSDADPLANYTNSADFMGVPTWVGMYGRLMEKVERLRTFIKKGSLVNESVDDTLQDIAVISILALGAYRQDHDKTGGEMT